MDMVYALLGNVVIDKVPKCNAVLVFFSFLSALKVPSDPFWTFLASAVLKYNQNDNSIKL